MFHAYWAHDEHCDTDPVSATQAYCKTHNIQLTNTLKDSASNKIHWDKRGLHQLIASTAQTGDTIITYDASSLARSALQLIEILQCMANRDLTLIVTKHDQHFAPGNTSATADLLALLFEAESDFVNKRTSDALIRRRTAGLPLGRPKGRKNKSRKLDRHRDDIVKYLKMNISKASIAKLVGCHAQTLYNYIDDCNLMSEIKSLQSKHEVRSEQMSA